MFTRLVTKSGDALWLWREQPALGRHEIARIEFDKWDRKREERLAKAK